MNPAISEPVDSQLARVVADELGVAQGYRHAPKQVVSSEPMRLPSAILKWYELFSEGHPAPESISRLAKKPIVDGALEVRGLGLVILHRCGDAFYFLIVATWRNENELWQTVWYKDGDAMAEFKPFPREDAHKPTYCVWELVPVWHEQRAWKRFLMSGRDTRAAQVWLADVFSGAA